MSLPKKTEEKLNFGKPLSLELEGQDWIFVRLD